MRGFFSLVSQTLVTLTVVSSTLAVPSAGCGRAPTLKANNTVTSGGKERYIIVKLPDGYDNKKPYRLVFTFHALGGSGAQLAQGGISSAYWDIPPVANNSAIFTPPNGQKAGSVGSMMGWGNRNGEDVKFVDDILATVSTNLCFTRTRSSQLVSPTAAPSAMRSPVRVPRSSVPSPS